jgi:hypothetical protein
MDTRKMELSNLVMLNEYHKYFEGFKSTDMLE